MAQSSYRPYQGFPYANPDVIDVPSLNAEEIAARSKWTNLPKKAVSSRPEQKQEDRPVIYIDPPEDQGSSVSSPSPVLSQPSASTSKRDSVPPVVYIDIPHGSSISQEREDEEEPEFIQDTIFFDPFKDQRIDQHQTKNAGPSQPGRSTPHNSLDINTASTANPSIDPSPSVPPLHSKEALVYGSHPDDGFPLSPIPVSDFPAPPPAYEEIEGETRRQQDREDPPRTQVITINQDAPPAIGLPQAGRKFLHCQHCGHRVHTLIIEENGLLTHLFAWSFILCCLFPITMLVYCCNLCRYSNHYCPNCNRKIGVKSPIWCTEFEYNL